MSDFFGVDGNRLHPRSVPPAAEAMVAPRLMPPLLIYRQRELVAANMKLRRQRNAAVLLDEVTGVDTAARRIQTRLAQAGSTIFRSSHTGSQYAYFGQGDWPKLAPGLKSIDDATLIRRRVLLAFEEARRAGRWSARAPLPIG